VVFPDAEVKVFLTASAEVRARRRFEELTAKGVAATWEETLDELTRRDTQDSSRAIAPLRQADGAALVDSSAMAPSAVIEVIAAMARAKDPDAR
jgi:cytidylate kinase